MCKDKLCDYHAHAAFDKTRKSDRQTRTTNIFLRNLRTFLVFAAVSLNRAFVWYNSNTSTHNKLSRDLSLLLCTYIQP